MMNERKKKKVIKKKVKRNAHFMHGWDDTSTRTPWAMQCVQDMNVTAETEQRLRRLTLRAHPRVHQVCHVIVGFHVLCVDLGFHVVIGVGRLTVQQDDHTYAIPSTKIFSSGCCSPTLSCHRQLILYTNFLHVSHRENGSFEVLSLQASSTASFTLSCQRCLACVQLPSLKPLCIGAGAPSHRIFVCTLPSSADAPQEFPLSTPGQHILGCQLLVHHVDVPLVQARRSDLGLVEAALDVLISDSSRPCKRRASRVLYLHTDAGPKCCCLSYRHRAVPTASYVAPRRYFTPVFRWVTSGWLSRENREAHLLKRLPV